ncbi:T9SS type A sorting domain-containing protein [Polaribacter sp. IC073]|uniref:T9SS type A sorting domain-containing protein n=1 Tax=Polaribacter sp. IC073 TaxID=2508540 RepID=UPI0011BFC673|nr:T9SS type A sorting domain-containing protein [Polaribacter sp. IC073]TXD46352.1 T9SS type A sorting domain-containing protein [Polaribacter sp. IC073]
MKKITLLLAIVAMTLTSTINAQNYGLKTTGASGEGFSSNQIGTLLSNQTAFTIQFWYEVQTFAGNTWVFKIEESGSNRIGLLTTGADNGGVYVRIGDGTTHGQQPFWGTDLKSTEGWNHVALTFDGGTVKLYINGLERSGGGISGSYPASTGDLSAEQFQIGWTTEVNIDELRITKGTALSAIDIAESSTPENFDAYFNFNDNERPSGAAASNSATANIGSDTTVLGQINNFATTYEVEDNATLSSKSFDTVNSLEMYPNPVSKEVNIKLITNTSGQVSVYSVTGSLLLHRNIINKSEIRLNTSTLTKGVYVIVFESESIRKVSKLIVK